MWWAGITRWVGIGGLFVLGGGCSSDDGGNPAAAQACRDSADAVATAAERCGLDYQANYDAFVATAAKGDCKNIVRVRDEAALYDVCIPFVAEMTCEQLQNPSIALPSECMGQLLW